MINVNDSFSQEKRTPLVMRGPLPVMIVFQLQCSCELDEYFDIGHNNILHFSGTLLGGPGFPILVTHLE